MVAIEPSGNAPAEQSQLTFSRAEQAQELVTAVQRLALARSLLEIQAIVRGAARRLTGADGATFILRDGRYSHYADEDAISPLWKGQRFLLDTCISGWAMRHGRSVVIEDIYADDRIPHDVYRPTFVKSLAMVPIRTIDPVGAIGNYWATHRLPSAGEVELLQALADSTAVAMENVRVYAELEQRVADRTAELERRTHELEEKNEAIRALYEEARRSFAATQERSEHHLEVLNTLAHEVRTPLVAGRIILRHELADANDGTPLTDVEAAMSEALAVVGRQLDAARLEAGALTVAPQDVDVAAELAALERMCRAFARSDGVTLRVEVAGGPLHLRTDPILLGHVLRNLVANALKFTDAGEVRVRVSSGCDGEVVFEIVDTGIGIAPVDVGRVFEPWRQVDGAQPHRVRGSGFGLPLVRRLVDVLGGRIELASEPGRGSTFTVTLPGKPPRARVYS